MTRSNYFSEWSVTSTVPTSLVVVEPRVHEGPGIEVGRRHR